MTERTEMTTADAADRHGRLAGFASLLIALKYVVSATMHFADEPTLGYLDMAEIALVAIAVVIIAPIFYWKLVKLPANEHHLYFRSDSFVVESMRTARKGSWAISMFSLFALEIAAKSLPDLPSRFFIQVAIAVVFGSFSILFLVLTSGGEDDA